MEEAADAASEVLLDAIVDLSWRAYPSGALTALGIALAVYGAGRLSTWRSVSAFDSRKPLVFVSGLRAVLVGAAIVGLGGAWLWQQLWMLLLSLAIGGEELLETSVVLYVLRRGRRMQQARQASAHTAPVTGPVARSG